MKSILDSAHAWFFDSLTQGASGALSICLTEGIKGADRQFVEVGETTLGPYFPVQVEPGSRCVRVTFEKALAFFVYDESYDTADPELKIGTGRYLFGAETYSFRRFAEARTSLAQVHQGPYQEFLLCCEDRIFHVLSATPPDVVLLQEQPDLTIERTTTWSTN